MAEYWKGPGCARFLPNKAQTIPHIAHKERERERERERENIYLEHPVVRNYCSKLKQHFFSPFGICCFPKITPFHGWGFVC